MTNPTYCNAAILPVVTKDLPIYPRFSLYELLSQCKVSALTTCQPMAEFLPTHDFRYGSQNTNSGFHRNRTHDFRTSRCTWLRTRPLGRRVTHIHKRLLLPTKPPTCLLMSASVHSRGCGNSQRPSLSTGSWDQSTLDRGAMTGWECRS